MISQKMMQLGKKRSTIREIFEYAKIRKAKIGDDKVFDFSIGNPSVPAPKCINDKLTFLLKGDSVALHGYTSAQGDKQTRHAIATHAKKTQGADIDEELIYMTMGASAALSITFHAICSSAEDEFIVFAPHFPEYKVFIESSGGKMIVSQSDRDTLMPDFDALEGQLNKNTKAVIINTPNNPTGVIYPESVIKRLSKLLKDKCKEFSTQIFLVTDEPYRELVYDDRKVPYVTNYYDNTIVCYSFSKVLSLPGERIGYISVCPKMKNATDVYAAVCGAGRSLGYVCCASLFQKMIPLVIGKCADLSIYKRNRDLLYDSLINMGYNCIHPDGAFYLFMQTPEEDAFAFCEQAKKYELLMVPSNDFGYEGFVRIAYCVTTKQIESALPAFEKLAVQYGLQPKQQKT
ncbi:MAG: pyridoxal phosphate-dependent aminotransferase [Clostridia bacterium]|nr:pyridoxal phosphate-dependent aminotransferase [Clostridia bacterium]